MSYYDEEDDEDARREDDPAGTIVVACPMCDGAKGWESDPTGYDPRDGAPRTHWVTCMGCDATGEVEIDVSMTADDWLNKWYEDE